MDRVSYCKNIFIDKKQDENLFSKKRNLYLSYKYNKYNL